MDRTAILIGGTFLPVTNAHMEMAKQAKNRMGTACNIFLVPSRLTFVADWKKVWTDEVFSDEARLNLLERVAEASGYEVSDNEVSGLTDGTTYETIRYFREKGYEKIFICIGMDKTDELPGWSRYREIFRHADILLFPRNGRRKADIRIPELMPYMDRIHEIAETDDIPDISSTMVREAFYRGDMESIRRMVPDFVYDYLVKSVIPEKETYQEER